jgi:NRAMP (natural resistance-associated macrophage protein)-like metal ion transporter
MAANHKRMRMHGRIHRAALLERLGPGLITGAADDDPSGIATYSQAGAAYGYHMLWTMVLTYPLMVGIQSVAARIGRVTGQGLGANLHEALPKPVSLGLIFLLFVANAINIGADLSAMGEAAKLTTGLGGHWWAAGFGLVSLLLQLFVPYHRYVKVLKWLTLVLFAYVAVILIVNVDWSEALLGVVAPQVRLDSKLIMLVVAIFGTTISPYLFFWQSSQEVEEIADHKAAKPLIKAPEQARGELKRIRLDTFVGMGFSNLIAMVIMIAAAATLHAHGKTDIATASEAAEALRPVAGQFAFALFSIGIIGTGMLAVPVLAGSAAYAVAECQGWRCGLEKKPWQAWGFYAVIILAMAVGVVVDFSPLDPIKALVWSAVINGVIAVPIMAATMYVASRRDEMGVFVATLSQRIFGWIATAVMAAASVAMFVALAVGDGASSL